MRNFLNDLRFGLRFFRGNPGFTAVAVLTLAIGIAANATVFSWIDGLLLHPYPGSANSGEFAVLQMSDTRAPNGADQLSYLDYLDYRRQMKALSGLSLHREEVFSLGESNSSQMVWGEMVTGNYFDVLGVKPQLGRAFSPAEDGSNPGAYPVAVISHRLWKSRFNESPRIIGQTMRVNRQALTIIGVTPPEFHGTSEGQAFDIWIPLMMGKELGLYDDSAFRDRGNRRFYGLGRVQHGMTREQANAEAATIAHNLSAAFPRTNRTVSANVIPVWERRTGAPDLLLKPLRILMAISLLVLLIVCANVANLLLARSLGRRKEFTIRMALGAGRWRLARQMLAETFLLSMGGAILGLILSSWAGDMLAALIPKVGLSLATGFVVNSRILAFAVVISVAAALLSGVVPALLWARGDIAEALNEGGRGGGPGAKSHRIQGMLVIAEVAFATVALVGAGLFLRSFQNSNSIYPGFDRTNVMLARFYLGGTGKDLQQTLQFSLNLRDRLKSNPGVAAVSYSSYPPLGANAGPYSTVSVEGYTPGVTESMDVNRYWISPGYFETLRIPLVSGRDFTDADSRIVEPVLIVNETFARRYFGGGPPIGRKVRFNGKWATVVGVAKDSKYFDVTEAPRPHFYAPVLQQWRADQQLYFFVRAERDTRPLMAGFRRDVAVVDPSVGAFVVMPLKEWTELTLLPQKVAASFMGVLGLVSLLLAAVGLYSVMAYAVARRTHEIGVRMALGAQPRTVLRDVLSRGAVLAGAGLAVGAAAALAVTRLVSGMLVNVGASDPLTFAGVAVFLSSIALVASYIPARRATRVDPMIALRWE